MSSIVPVQFLTMVNGVLKKISLKNALYNIPELIRNLVSVRVNTDDGYDVLFTANGAKVFDKRGRVALVGKWDFML